MTVYLDVELEAKRERSVFIPYITLTFVSLFLLIAPNPALLLAIFLCLLIILNNAQSTTLKGLIGITDISLKRVK